MGIRYGIHLYFPIDKLACAVEEIVKLTETSVDGRMSIRLPENKTVIVACEMTSVGDGEQRHLTIDNDICYRTSFLLPLDSYIQTHLEWHGKTFTNTADKVNLGNFLVGLHVGTSYAEISIYAVSSSQNEILLKSPVMHQVMQDMLIHCNGLFGLIDIQKGDGAYERLWLSDIQKQVAIDAERSDYGEDIDYIVSTVQQKLDH